MIINVLARRVKKTMAGTSEKNQKGEKIFDIMGKRGGVREGRKRRVHGGRHD